MINIEARMEEQATEVENSSKPVKYGWRFWAVFPGLCIGT